MWRLLRYGAVFAAGQAFQHLMERHEAERLDAGIRSTDGVPLSELSLDDIIEMGLRNLELLAERFEERRR